MKTVITYGTFDLFHVGHVNLLQRARALGDRLIVGVSTDEFNLNEKGKTTIVPFEHRVKVLESCRYVDQVIPEHNWRQKESDIKKYDVDIFVIGDDWQGKFDELKSCCDVIYLPRTRNISSTAIKQAMAVIEQLNKELN
ncbi:glycerol-3-phosphate cytidylyltransferase [Methylotuvimicrobium alcaliphilum]|uniref:Glycerol-3-phosphate cytidylyltransferase n=1 Tax=Methylotuvimicrobium alcaliphilum (strain DSM 19304 / NCIMB 14124 / VKM B-2133 / 20Z) TaxID=1091494 RepID=G4T1K7_META2|nr:glycerol-3-phosphate cytidylyltransferase [Methylotuvimicrobium alcaliphilum]CCE22429.1 glycerol-3-phosphate cytidylyltransferase [Methylotuvimicrobium alcaliphilum 20Z]